MIKNILAAAVIGAVAMGAQASTNLVQNGAVDGSTTSYTYNDTPATVQQFYGAVPSTSGTVANWDGSFVSIASGNGDWGNPSGLTGFSNATFGGYVAGIQADATLYQSLDLAAGTYKLTWSDANRNWGGNQSYSVTFGNVTVDTLATQVGAGWHTQTVTFTLAEDTEAYLSFVGGTSYGNTDATTFIDNVSVTAVPEPTSLLMMGVAALGLVGWRRRSQV
jgi:hypothetical protein